MMMNAVPDYAALRAQVRRFLASEAEAGGFVPKVDSWVRGFSREFSRRLAQRGWVAMTVPERFGGAGRTHLERFVVAEELLAAGAPVLAHWAAERQVAPMLLRIGTEEQQRRLLPGIVRGESCFAIGLSEPDSGSDLASVRTKAARVDGGWEISGQKVWTSAGHLADFMFVLCRTSESSQRHEGLSQLMVTMSSAGVTARPISTMSGEAEFAEVFFDRVFVPDTDVIGEVGHGWQQVTTELGWERNGPDRYLSTYPLLARFFELEDDSLEVQKGRLAAQLIALRALAFEATTKGQEGLDFAADAALVKDAGTRFEQDSIEVVRRSLGSKVADHPELDAHLKSAQFASPTFTIRGGTNEILRTITARRLVER
ncbi:MULTISPECIES: acyl-CoA dehydrogenase family protein [Streptomyces]|nr:MULTISPECIES: acyl-CoA dehydrogenase family protein [Streptomyces]EXU64362.1 acyl-CoA dehydrogenase [Streptomyces sp. PRh5]